MKAKTVVITLRVSPETVDKIALAVEKSGRDQADILREAVTFGLEDLERVGFDPLTAARSVIDQLKLGEAILSANFHPPLSTVEGSAEKEA